MSGSSENDKESDDVICQPSEDMMNMFASVWVKVEIDEEEESRVYNAAVYGDNTQAVTGDGKKSLRKPRKRKAPTKRPPKNLKCTTCEYTTSYKNCLDLHMLGHTNAKPLACDTCEYTTRYPTSLQRHMLIQHEFKAKGLEKEAKILNCDQCSYTTYFKWNLNAHTRKHNLEKKFKCEFCTYSTAYRHNYVKHSKVHATNKQEVVYKCDKCPFITKFEGHISRHLAQIHNEVSDKANRCDMCDFSTKVKWRLNIHKQRSKQNNVLKCTFCEFETIYKCASKKHKIVHYGKIYGTKEVSNRGETRSQTEEIPTLSQNENQHFEPEINHSQGQHFEPVIANSYSLNENYQFESESNDPNLSKHEKNNHYKLDPNCEIDWNNIQVIENQGKDRPFQCVMCKYDSKFKASVQRHFQRHHTGNETRPYKCTNCGFSTKTKDQISLHNKRSQSIMTLYCKECNFSTNFKCQIVAHQKNHNAYRCHLCDYSCKVKYDFQKHMAAAHMGKTLKCQFCDYKTARKESLISHETTHTGNKPFKCSHCDYTSVRKTLLDNHMKRNHSVVKNDPVIVSDSKIQSLKITLNEEALKNQNVDMRDQNLSNIEEFIIKNKEVLNEIINSSKNVGESLMTNDVEMNESD